MLSRMQMTISFPPISIGLMQGKQNENNRKYKTKILMTDHTFLTITIIHAGKMNVNYALYCGEITKK